MIVFDYRYAEGREYRRSRWLTAIAYIEDAASLRPSTRRAPTSASTGCPASRWWTRDISNAAPVPEALAGAGRDDRPTL